MKILRIFLKGPHLRFVEMPVPPESNMVMWTKALEQQGYLVSETFMVMRDCIEALFLFDGAAPNNVTPFIPKPVA